MSRGRKASALAVAALLAPMLASAKADGFEPDYQPPASGVTVKVSAPDPTTTPIAFDIVIDGVQSTAAVLASGWYRYKAIVADGTLHPKIAQNPKAKALPSEAEFLVPADKTVILIARSHAELVGRSDIKTCSVPFVFKPREGFRYLGRWKMAEDGCAFAISEQPLEPADAPATPLTSLEPPAKSK